MGLQYISAQDREALNSAAKRAKGDVEHYGRVLPSTVRQGRIAASKIKKVQR